MNKKSIILAASALALVLSCNVREDVLPLPQKTVFKAVMADAPSTKTVLQSDGAVFWTPGDAINLFYGDAVSTKMVFDSSATGAVAQASFAGSLPAGFSPNGTDEFWAVYPYSKDNSFDGSTVTLSLPEVQTGVAGTFADDLFISLARSTGYELSFYNLCGGIKFSVSTPGITRVVFSGTQESCLAGKVKVSFNDNGKPLIWEIVEGYHSIYLDAPSGGFEVGKWYYIVSFPCTLLTGATLTFLSNDEMVAERHIDSGVSIKRSVWGRITNADVVDSGSQPSNEIWYTSTDGAVVNPYDGASFGEDISIVSNTYEDGLGIIKFDGPVTRIGYNAFGSSSSTNPGKLKSIFIPEGCLEIGQFAFQYCSNMDEVKLPETLITIGGYSFYGCSSLGEILLPDSLTDIGNCAFTSCSSLTEISIPESVSNIEGYVFASCTGLERFMGKYADESGRALIDGTRLVAVAPSGLTTYSVADGITVIGAGAFEGFANLTEIILPDGLQTLLGESFADCDGLTELTIPETALYWGGGDFRYCDNLVRVNIPSDITLIPGECFAGCKSLLEITIPSKVTRIGSFAFESCSGLEKVFVEAVTPPTGNTQMFNRTNDCPIYVPAESVDAYKAAEYWSEYADRIQAMPGDISASKYLTITSEGTTTVSMRNEGNNAPVLYYSTDAQHWTSWDYGEIVSYADAPLYICGDNPDGFSSSSSDYSMFTSEGDSFAVSGDIMSLINYSSDVLDIPSPYCFFMLFGGNNILTSGPELPATGLTEGCYSSMYANCINLASAPVFPAATTLAQFCYQNMFFRCSNLVEAPALPFTTLAEYCYHSMFYYSGLKEAPVLPASVLVTGCYTDMFYGCTELASVKCLATDITAYGCLTDWLYAVADQGVFVKDANTQWPSGSSGIPEGWTVEDAVSANNYLTFSSRGSSWMYLTSSGGGEQPVLYYSYDTESWKLWDYSSLTFTSDTPLYLCGSNPNGFSFDATAYNRFMIYGDSCSVSGDVMSLLDKDEELTEIPNAYCFALLFGGDSLVSGPDLPATSLTTGCYYGMFQGNTSLTSAPALPAESMAENCYASMFYGCTSLTTAPELPATSLASSCYANMFHGCTALAEAPSLPVMNLGYRCYYGMFQECTSLVTAPALPATTMADECYYTMFLDCTALTSAPELPATTLAPSCYWGMFGGCSALETAPELPATTLAGSCYYNMFERCASLTTAPILAAPTLEFSCYAAMFAGCSNLSYVKCLATDISASECTLSWMNSVSSTGLFIKAANSQWPTGINGIPEGWTVEDAQ